MEYYCKIFEGTKGFVEQDLSSWLKAQGSNIVIQSVTQSQVYTQAYSNRMQLTITVVYQKRQNPNTGCHY